MPLTFCDRRNDEPDWLYTGMFFAGFLYGRAVQLLGNYLPRVYPLHLRGTG